MEVIDPVMTIKAIGLLKNGLKSYILNKKKDTWSRKYTLGQNNIIQSHNISYPACFWLHQLTPKNPKVVSAGKITLGSNAFLFDTKNSFHTQCRAINRIGPHNIDVISVIFGLLLGDGYASNRSGEGVRFCIKQSNVHKEY